jgi:hypothetical protein
MSASATITNGGFYDGTRNPQRVAISIRLSYRLLADFALQRNDITLRTPVAAFPGRAAILKYTDMVAF